MYRKLLLWLCLLLALAARPWPRTRAHRTRRRPPNNFRACPSSATMKPPNPCILCRGKSSEIGAETGLNMMLTERAVPVDREVFMRQVDLFEISAKK